VLYAELSIAFETMEKLEAVPMRGQFSSEAIPREALFLAGNVFLQYRKRKVILNLRLQAIQAHRRLS